MGKKGEKSEREGCNEMAQMTVADTQKINVMSNIRRIARKAIKAKGLSETEVRKSLGKRYER